MAEMSALTQEVALQKLRGFVQPLNAKYGVLVTGLVGSFARNSEKADSDVDVSAKVVGEPTLFDLARMAGELEQLLGRQVDLVFPDDLPPRKRTFIMRDFIPL